MIPADGMKIGSIGCGWATTEAVLVSQGREVHGVDISPEAVDRAKSRITSVRLISPGDRSVFPKDSLDGLILADVIEHLPHAWDALKEFAIAVRPGGWVVISVPNMWSIKVFFRFFLRGDWPEDPQGVFDATHLQVMSPKRLKRWCLSAGLVLEASFDVYLTAGVKRKFLQAVDLLTFRLFHHLWLNQVQFRCRKR